MQCIRSVIQLNITNENRPLIKPGDVYTTHVIKFVSAKLRQLFTVSTVLCRPCCWLINANHTSAVLVGVQNLMQETKLVQL